MPAFAGMTFLPELVVRQAHHERSEASAYLKGKFYLPFVLSLSKDVICAHSVFMSMTKRYRTSPTIMRSYASFTF